MNLEGLYGQPDAVRRLAALGDIPLAETAAAWRLARFPESPLWREWYGPQDHAAIALVRGDAALVLKLTEAIQPRNHLLSFVPMLGAKRSFDSATEPARPPSFNM